MDTYLIARGVKRTSSVGQLLFYSAPLAGHETRRMDDVMHYSSPSDIHLFCCEQHATHVALVSLSCTTGLFNIALLMLNYTEALCEAPH
jgi:hypothetical protein